MDKPTIQTLIDKVIGKKGLIRVPSWWMRKVLMQMVDWVQEGDDANSEKIVKIDEDTTKLRNLTLPYMLVSGTGIVNIDGNRISFTDADKQLMFITGAINFKKGDGYNDNPIAYIYIPHLDVRSQGRDMAFMFYRCSNLTSLNVTGFDTSAVTSMESMFNGCSNLTSLNLTGFNTSAVTNMNNMFRQCSSLTSLDVTRFNTSAVTSMEGMFESCYGLTSLDITRFDTSAVTNMASMFRGCSKLTSLNVTGFDTSSVMNMDSMFNGCRKLTSLDLSSFNTSVVTSMESMFYSCLSLTSLNLSSFDTSMVTNLWMLFDDCKSLTSLILGPNFFKMPNVKVIEFTPCINWTNDTVVTSLVTNSYDRAMAGLSTMTLKLSANTKAALTNEQKAAITAKGYTIA